MQEHARDRVVLVEMMEAPGALEVPFYERVYGSAPTPLPGLPNVLDLLWAMNIFPDVAMVSSEPAVLDTDRDAALEQLRRRLGVREGDVADERLRAAADDLLEETPDGLTVRGVAPQRQAIVTWRAYALEQPRAATRDSRSLPVIPVQVRNLAANTRAQGERRLECAALCA